MNKTLASLALAALLVPSAAFAQTTTDATTHDQAIVALINALKDQVIVLEQRLAALSTPAITTHATTMETPAAGSIGFSFNVTATVAAGAATINTDQAINEAHVCVTKDGDQQCAYFKAPDASDDKGSAFILKNQPAGAYTFTIKGIKYGPSGQYGGLSQPFDSESYTASGEFSI